MGNSELRHRTARGLLWGGIGSGTMQLLNLLFGIFLSRLLSPDDYGVIGALTIFSATAGLFAESGFTYAIANKKTVTHDDYNSVFWFNIAIGSAFYLLLYFLAPVIAGFYDKPEMTQRMIPLARFLFLGFLVGSIGTAPSAYFFRNLNVKIKSQIQIAAIIVSGATGVVCALNDWGYWGIAVQTVLYASVNTLLLWISVPWHPTLTFKWHPIAEMLPFSSRQLFTSLFTHINNNFFSMLLGRFYSLKTTGFYTQGSKWTTMGYSTITGMLNSVALPVMREASQDNNERVCRVFIKMLRFTAFISFPAMFGLGIIATELITLTVTDKWLQCVPVMQILCVWGAFAPIATLYANLFNSINRPNIYMWNTISLGLTQLLSVIISYPYGLNVMLMVYTAVNIMWLGVWQFFAHRYVKLPLLSVLTGIAPYMIIALAVMALTYLATMAITRPLLSLLAKVTMAALMYCLTMKIFKSVIFSEVLDYFFKRKKL